MTQRDLLSATAAFALLSSLLLGCQVQVPSDGTQSKGSSPAGANSESAKKSPIDGSTAADPSTGGDDSDPSTPEDDESSTPTSADTTGFSDMHWSTPNGAGVTFYDVEFSSDGTYRKQQIIYSSSGSLLHCEYGSWKASGAGKLELVSTCTGDTYEQPWSQSTDGDLVLHGVEYSQDPSGVWNCAATECK